MDNRDPFLLDSIFDIIHSLPASSHSVGLANKNPAMAFDQSSMYFPDYGGVLEVPGIPLKNYGFVDSLPFNPKPTLGLVNPVTTFSRESKHASNNSLISIPFPDSSADHQYLIVRSLGSDIYMDLVSESEDGQMLNYSAKQYSHMPMMGCIHGLKYFDEPSRALLVRFEHEIKMMRLSEFTPEYRDAFSHIHDSPIYNDLITIELDTELVVKDASLNPHNRRLQTIACDGPQTRRLLLYDLTTSTNLPIQNLSWSSAEDGTMVTENDEPSISQSSLRKRKLIFKPIKEIRRGIQQLDNIPTHLVNMLVTTDHRTFIFDPRKAQPASYIVDRSKLESCLPIEYLCKTQFSPSNPYQFYSLTNVNLRVFDYRYPLTPMNQVSHMLDSDLIEKMLLKVVPNLGGFKDTLCIACGSRLCWISFDQSQRGNLVNPRSEHMPYHECNISDRLMATPEVVYGLDVRSPSNVTQSVRDFCSVFQMYESGKVSVRKYKVQSMFEEAHQDQPTQVTMMTEDELSEQNRAYMRDKFDEECDLEPRDVLEEPRSNLEDDSLQLNILDPDIVAGIDSKFESRRALERYHKMISKI